MMDKLPIVERWRDGNEAIHAKIDRSRPWCGTVFMEGNDDQADGLVAMTFGADIEECLARAKLAASAPQIWAEVQELKAAEAKAATTITELVSALERCLNFIENTEGELGITLDSGELARTTLSTVRGETK
jgi:hypothetical protein